MYIKYAAFISDKSVECSKVGWYVQNVGNIFRKVRGWYIQNAGGVFTKRVICSYVCEVFKSWVIVENIDDVCLHCSYCAHNR